MAEDNALVVQEKKPTTFAGFPIEHMSQIKEFAQILLKSQLMPPAIKTPEQAIILVMKGHDLGLTYMQSIESINVIQGKPALSASLIQAKIRQSGVCKYLTVKEMSDKKCIIETLRTDEKLPFTYEFGEKEAKDAGLFGKDNYKKQPKVMYFNRAMSGIGRYCYADVFFGSIYVPEELGEEVAVRHTDTPEFTVENNDDPLGIKGDTMRGTVIDPTTEKLNWGAKHKDRVLSDVPSAYLRWIIDDSNASDEIKAKAKAGLDFKVDKPKPAQRKTKKEEDALANAKEISFDVSGEVTAEPEVENDGQTEIRNRLAKEEAERKAMPKVEDAEFSIVDEPLFDEPMEDAPVEEISEFSIDFKTVKWGAENSKITIPVLEYKKEKPSYSPDEVATDNQKDFLMILTQSLFLTDLEKNSIKAWDTDTTAVALKEYTDHYVDLLMERYEKAKADWKIWKAESEKK